jgi:hypothetical protein
MIINKKKTNEKANKKINILDFIFFRINIKKILYHRIIMKPSSSNNNLNPSIMSRIQINDSKAGMENIDKEKINAIIMKHSQSK